MRGAVKVDGMCPLTATTVADDCGHRIEAISRDVRVMAVGKSFHSFILT